MMPSYDSEFQRSNVESGFKQDLQGYMRRLNDGYNFFLEEKMKLHYDEELFTECIALMLTITANILPKLEGGGAKTEKMFTKIKVYEPWLTDVMLPKIHQREKVNDLYRLILEAYDLLGLSSLE
jgi:hypothetical protein